MADVRQTLVDLSQKSRYMMDIDVGSFGTLSLAPLLYHRKTQSSFVRDCMLIHRLTARITAKDALVGLKGCRLREEIFINLRDRRRVGMGSLEVRRLGHDIGCD